MGSRGGSKLSLDELLRMGIDLQKRSCGVWEKSPVGCADLDFSAV